jgi:hypothetical protein
MEDQPSRLLGNAFGSVPVSALSCSRQAPRQIPQLEVGARLWID